jgi:hypothetical protein
MVWAASNDAVAPTATSSADDAAQLALRDVRVLGIPRCSAPEHHSLNDR